VDFGLAKANSQLEITDEGVVKGKFSYLAPETALGHTVDARADVFALGILLWEMLTERRLFLGENPHETVSLIRRARVPSLTAINPSIDAELEGIVRKALARELQDRYETAADLGEALTTYLFSHGLKATARDVALAVRATQAARARRASPGAALADALVKDELEKLTQVVADELRTSHTIPPPLGTEGLVDTKGWVDDLLRED
jgi:eukaryotic-like serine/threonine-protein kinase